MSVQMIRGIPVMFKTFKPHHPCVCNPDDGECVFYAGTRQVGNRIPCPPESLEPGTTCFRDSGNGVWVAAPQDEQAQDSSVPSMVAP